jgi:hypothetical protein
MKQTAVEWLVEQLNIWQTIADEDTNATLDTVRKLIEKAKAMEKEQMIEARATAPLLASIDKDDYIKEAEQYYNETYEKR